MSITGDLTFFKVNQKCLPLLMSLGRRTRPLVASDVRVAARVRGPCFDHSCLSPPPSTLHINHGDKHYNSDKIYRTDFFGLELDKKGKHEENETARSLIAFLAAASSPFRLSLEHPLVSRSCGANDGNQHEGSNAATGNSDVRKSSNNGSGTGSLGGGRLRRCDNAATAS